MVASAAALLTPAPRWEGLEGPRWRMVIGPGMVQIASHDPARAARTHERNVAGRRLLADLRGTDHWLEERRTEVGADLEAAVLVAGMLGGGGKNLERLASDYDHLSDRIAVRDRESAPEGAARITGWSAKSRARMVRRLAEVDYAPLFLGDGLPAMLTLTYPGDWRKVAPDAPTCTAQLKALRKRFARAYGRPMLAIWKREFQRRGAPHFHFLMVPPVELVNGETFAAWISRTWAELVGAQSCGEAEPSWAMTARGAAVIVCCERHKHVAAGTGIDYAEGMRARDPKRLAVYFSKHGSFAGKEYQNSAPAEWIRAGSVGRFWGIWGLETATVAVEVSAVEALAAARTLRRWQRANGFRVQATVFRTDTRTGVIRTRKSGVWVGARMRGHAGFVVVNDGADVGSMLARYMDQVRVRAQDAEVAAWLASPARLMRLDVEAACTDVSIRTTCRVCLGPLDAALAARGMHVGECWTA